MGLNLPVALLVLMAGASQLPSPEAWAETDRSTRRLDPSEFADLPREVMKVALHSWNTHRLLSSRLRMAAASALLVWSVAVGTLAVRAQTIASPGSAPGAEFYLNRANATLFRHPSLALGDFHRAGMYPERLAAMLGGAALSVVAGIALARRKRIGDSV
jgi:hypothetical protein